MRATEGETKSESETERARDTAVHTYVYALVFIRIFVGIYHFMRHNVPPTAQHIVKISVCGCNVQKNITYSRFDLGYI